MITATTKPCSFSADIFYCCVLRLLSKRTQDIWNLVDNQLLIGQSIVDWNSCHVTWFTIQKRFDHSDSKEFISSALYAYVLQTVRQTLTCPDVKLMLMSKAFGEPIINLRSSFWWTSYKFTFQLSPTTFYLIDCDSLMIAIWSNLCLLKTFKIFWGCKCPKRSCLLSLTSKAGKPSHDIPTLASLSGDKKSCYEKFLSLLCQTYSLI